ncbi:MAG: isoprenylcysteine carboxylmethyltransferase family protein [Helicobacteraceae bacterium]|jgi:protein-S-isoprenylcysteine O-methyltransferase Ste14|nr:isoprenylcysteine carboxylmethyltransferase family protein [Helicobacteraceae bacterium]
MRKYLRFSYSVIGYVLSISTLSFLILWVYPWKFMQFNIDTPVINLEVNPVLINISLLLFFALQHSIMARSFFKEGLLKNVSNTVKSASYSVASSLCLILMFYFWQPIDGYIWNVQNGVISWSITTLYVVGWLVAFLATFIIDHFELFGLHQGYRAFKNIPEPKIKFQISYLYKYIRHPVQAGTLVGLWATPSMSYSHLVLSVGMTIYVFIGLHYEEKSLITTFGKEYDDYMKNTPMLIPFINTKNRSLERNILARPPFPRWNADTNTKTQNSAIETPLNKTAIYTPPKRG